VPNSAGFDEERVKSLTGSDRVSARGMREDFTDFAPRHKFVVCVNHLPTVRDASDGFWRRVRFVPFNVSFRGKEDRGLLDALKVESVTMSHARSSAMIGTRASRNATYQT
jgi:putative DNA primase/helicase